MVRLATQRKAVPSGTSVSHVPPISSWSSCRAAASGPLSPTPPPTISQVQVRRVAILPHHYDLAIRRHRHHNGGIRRLDSSRSESPRRCGGGGGRLRIVRQGEKISWWRTIRSDWLRLHNGEETHYDYVEQAEAPRWCLTTDGKIVVIATGPDLDLGDRGSAACRGAPRRLPAAKSPRGDRRDVPRTGAAWNLLSERGESHRPQLQLSALDVELGEPSARRWKSWKMVLLEPDEAFQRARIDESQSALAILMAEPLIPGLAAGSARSPHSTSLLTAACTSALDASASAPVALTISSHYPHEGHGLLASRGPRWIFMRATFEPGRGCP